MTTPNPTAIAELRRHKAGFLDSLPAIRETFPV